MKDLLYLARESILEELNPKIKANITRYQTLYKQKQHVFITLQKNNHLRGCIGQLKSEKPLWQNVYEMAKKAAFYDHRFPPLTQQELPDIVIELSILSPLYDIKGIEEIILGKHGVQITIEKKSAIFLPEVAIQQHWTKQDLLEQVAKKAGVAKEEWKTGKIKIFTTIKIKET